MNKLELAVESEARQRENASDERAGVAPRLRAVAIVTVTAEKLLFICGAHAARNPRVALTLKIQSELTLFRETNCVPARSGIGQ